MAVVVRNVFLAIDKERILDGACLKVPKGSIYGLLGPSGCGKTTLLKCVLGRLKPDEGCIELFENKVNFRKRPKCAFGFMPQELSLYFQFNIQETLDYFGKITGLSKSVIESKSEELIDLLELPKTKLSVRSLSSGQQRRLSLTVALLHNPQLLILDEPTVGVDAVVREKIWFYLNQLSNQGITVLITTHYIEEASLAHVIAFMREGRILIEASPKAIKNALNCSTLESAFVKFCKEGLHYCSSSSPEQQKLSSIESFGMHNESIETFSRSSSDESFEECRKKVQKAYFWKLILVAKKRPFLMTFYIWFPFLMNLIFLSPFNDIGDFPVAVVNMDNGNVSDLILKNFQKTEIILNYFDAFDQAAKSVKSDQNKALFLIPQDYTATLFQNATPSTFLFNDGVNPRLLSIVEARLFDAFNKTGAEMQDLNLNAFKYFKKGFGLKLVRENETFRKLAGKGILLCLLWPLMVFITSELATEMSSGFLERSFISGLNPSNIIISSFIFYYLLSFVQVLLDEVIAVVTSFKDSSFTNQLLVYFLMMQQAVYIILMSILIALMTKNRNAVAVIGTISFYPLVFLSGFVRSPEAMTSIFDFLAKIYPFSLSLPAVKDIFLLNTFFTFNVMMCVTSTLVWTCGFIIVIFVIQNRVL